MKRQKKPKPAWTDIEVPYVPAESVPPPGTKRPPNARGQGRPPLKPGQPTVTLSLRVTKGQRDKLDRLGGAPWVRDKIDRAKDQDP